MIPGNNSHKDQIEAKYELKIKLEELRHRNIMKELAFMKNANINSFERGYNPENEHQDKEE